MPVHLKKELILCSLYHDGIFVLYLPTLSIEFVCIISL